jgi:two-component system sensor histidine kinase KdpD
MTRLESGGLVAHKEWTPLEEVVGSALGRLEVPLGDRPVAVELARDLPLAFIDALLMEQALVNLVENAAKYTPTGSPIDIWARSEQGMLVIDVADRGPGIPEEERERIFEKLYRLGPGDGLSAGLGLAICKGIVAAHGGEIAALSRPDGGTIFRITLPQPEDQPQMPREESD